MVPSQDSVEFQQQRKHQAEKLVHTIIPDTGFASHREHRTRSKISHCDESRSTQNANTNFYARILGAMPPTNPYKCNPVLMEGYQVDSSIRDPRLTHDGNRNLPPFLQSKDGLTLSSNHNLSLSTHDGSAQSFATKPMS
jgi:hypothetical protein